MKIKHESLPTIKPIIIKLINYYISKHPFKINIADLGSGSQTQIINGIKNKHLLNYTAVDADSDCLIQFSENTVKKNNITLKTIHGDIQVLPLKKANYDIVLCLETLEHIKNPSNALKKILSIAKPDSVIIFSTPNINRVDVF